VLNINNTVTNRVRRTRISRAARGRFAPGVNARCVLIVSFVYFTAFVYNFRGYRDELAESPAKSKLSFYAVRKKALIGHM
jgi:hypothetical protein